MPLGGGPGSQSESDAGSTTRGIHGGGGFGSNYGGFGVTGVAADFGSDPDGLSTNADVGLDYSGGGEGIRRDTAAGMFFGFPGSAFEAAREMAEFNTVPGGREYVRPYVRCGLRRLALRW